MRLLLRAELLERCAAEGGAKRVELEQSPKELQRATTHVGVLVGEALEAELGCLLVAFQQRARLREQTQRLQERARTNDDVSLRRCSGTARRPLAAPAVSGAASRSCVT